ncbi:hypothetical protein AYO45_06510 [Gammaproteobacteria bacterium SCGC AG-212-F23]|nr:hypothetical protein AYO45_06510 [Gammaproteobacteria bacterium SCGC AG-212-F23]
MTASHINKALTATTATDAKFIAADSKTVFAMPLPERIEVIRQERKVRYYFSLGRLADEKAMIADMKSKHPEFCQAFNITGTTISKVEPSKRRVIFDFTQDQLDNYFGKHFFKLMYLIDCLIQIKTVAAADEPMLDGAFTFHETITERVDGPVIKRATVKTKEVNTGILERNIIFLFRQFSNDQLNYFAQLSVMGYPRGGKYGVWFFMELFQYMPKKENLNVLERLTPETCMQLFKVEEIRWLLQTLMSEAFLIYFNKLPSSKELVNEFFYEISNDSNLIFCFLSKNPIYFAAMIEKFKKNKEYVKNKFLEMLDADQFGFSIKASSLELLYRFSLQLVHYQPIQNILDFLDLLDEKVEKLGERLSCGMVATNTLANNHQARLFLRAMHAKFEPVLRDSTVVVSPHIRKFYTTMVAPLLKHDAENPIAVPGYRVLEQGIREFLNDCIYTNSTVEIILDYLNEAYQAIALLNRGDGLLTFHSDAYLVEAMGFGVCSTVLISKSLFTPIPTVGKSEFSLSQGDDDSPSPMRRGVGFLYDVSQCKSKELTIHFQRLNHGKFLDVTTREYAAAQPFTGNCITIDSEFARDGRRGIYIDVLSLRISEAKNIARSMRNKHFERLQNWLPIFFYNCEAKKADAVYPYTEAEQAADAKCDSAEKSSAMTATTKK